MRPAVQTYLKAMFIVTIIVTLAACAPYSRQRQHVEYGDMQATIPIVVKGNGIEPMTGTPQQKVLLANRAAVVDAYRNLSERVAGLVVASYTRQGEAIVSTDHILTETNSYLHGVRVIDVSNANGISTATVKVDLPRAKFFSYVSGSEGMDSSSNQQQSTATLSGEK